VIHYSFNGQKKKPEGIYFGEYSWRGAMIGKPIPSGFNEIPNVIVTAAGRRFRLKRNALA